VSYAEFDAPVIASAIFHHTAATASTARFCWLWNGSCHNPSHSAWRDQPLHERELGGQHLHAVAIASYCSSITGTIRESADPYHLSSRQLFHQSGLLLQQCLAARWYVGSIGSEINGWQINGRLIRSVDWVPLPAPDLSADDAIAISVAPPPTIGANTSWVPRTDSVN